jgi:hypothetical protein
MRRESEAPVVRTRDGLLVRVWMFERVNSEDLAWGQMRRASSYSESERRHVLRQRGFDTEREIERELLWTGETRYMQEVMV